MIAASAGATLPSGEGELEVKRARILVTGSYAPSLVNFRGPLIAAMAARGHTVFALAPAIDAGMAAAIRQLGAEPVTLRLANTSMNPVSLVKSYWELRRLIRTLRPDAMLSYTIKPVILGALAGRAERVSRIISLITGLGYAFTEGPEAKRGVARAVASLLYRRALARSDLIVFQNCDDHELFAQLGLLPVSVHAEIVDGSGVDIDLFSPCPLPSEPSFLMISRLLRDKGTREFATAAARIVAEYPQARVGLVGYFDSSPDCVDSSVIDDMVAAGVSFHGKLDDVRPAIAACSVYVLPSYREGTPRSVLEAMAMGRAIITTDAPGCRETVVDGLNGLLVPARDVDALYAAMKRFVERPQLAGAMGAQSRKLAEKRYDARKVSADIIRHAGL